MCHGKKIPSVKHGKFTCKRNVDGEGKKKGKGRKCTLKMRQGLQNEEQEGQEG